MRLIDADALIKRCMNGIDNEFIGIVNEIPTVKVLDKIRAEIETLESPFGSYGEWYDGRADCLEIIDKYRKGENE